MSITDDLSKYVLVQAELTLAKKRIAELSAPGAEYVRGMLDGFNIAAHHVRLTRSCDDDGKEMSIWATFHDAGEVLRERIAALTDPDA